MLSFENLFGITLSLIKGNGTRLSRDKNIREKQRKEYQRLI